MLYVHLYSVYSTHRSESLAKVLRSTNRTSYNRCLQQPSARVVGGVVVGGVVVGGVVFGSMVFGVVVVAGSGIVVGCVAVFGVVVNCR